MRAAQARGVTVRRRFLGDLESLADRPRQLETIASLPLVLSLET